jgi:hypothetical protein
MIAWSSYGIAPSDRTKGTIDGYKPCIEQSSDLNRC